MAKKIYILPIETAVRELDYKLALALKLVDRGHRVFIGSKSKISYLLECFKDFNFLDKGYHIGVSEDLHNRIYNLSGEIFSLDEEGAVDFENNTSLKNRYSENCFKYPKKVFFWGLEQKNKYTKDLNKSIISGHPRFHMLDKKYDILYLEEKNKLMKKYGNFILVNTNMSFGNNIRGTDFVIKNYNERFKDIKKIIDQDLKKIIEICNSIKSLSKKGYKVVIRPHPEESHFIYKQKLKNFSNIHINNDGGVVPWLMAASNIIHTDCTTAIEASWLGKMPISILPGDIDKQFTCPLPIDLSIKSSSLEILSDLNKHKIQSNECHTILEKYLSYSLNSLEIISNSLADDGKPLGKINLGFLKFKLIKLYIKSYIDGGDELIESKLRGFNKKNVFNKLDILSKILRIEKAIKINKHIDHFYEISS